MELPSLETQSGLLLGLLYHCYIPEILSAAISLNVFETLSHEKMTLTELSEKLDTYKAVTEALLGVLLALKLAEKSGDRYGLTGTAREFLLEGSGANIMNAVNGFVAGPSPFENMRRIMQDGPGVFNDRMWSSREAALAMEQQNMGGMIQAVLAFAKEQPGFGGCENMCDYAGSLGYYAFAFMQENPALRAHVWDLPEVCSLGRELKRDEPDYQRITFHDFDTARGDSFGSGYDLFFCSNFLSEYNVNGTLTGLLKKVNDSMNPGGLFISSHIPPATAGENHLELSIIELWTRLTGYPTHLLSEEDLKKALTAAGFGEFRTSLVKEVRPWPVLLLSAVKPG